MEKNSPLNQINFDTNLLKFVLPILLLLPLLFLREILGIIVSKILTDSNSVINDPKNDLYLNLILNVATIILMLFAIWILIKLSILKLNPQKPNENFGIKETAYSYLIAFSIVYVFGIIMTTLTSFTKEIPESSYESITLVPENLTIINIVLLFLLLSVLAPIFEELVFRRLLIPMLEGGYGTFGALIISAIIFGLIHTDNDLINGNTLFAFFHLINAVILGLGIGFVYILTRNIIYPILFHGFNNFLPFITQLILAFLDIDINAEIDPNRISEYSVLFIVSIFILLQVILGLVIIGKILIKKERKRKIRLFLEQIPSSIMNSMRQKIFFGFLTISIFAFFTVIWTVIVRVFIYNNILVLNNDDTIIFVILTDILFIILFVIVLYLSRSNTKKLFLLTNPEIDLDVINKEVYQKELLTNHNIEGTQLFCVYCGSKLQEKAYFCINCGKKREGM